MSYDNDVLDLIVRKIRKLLNKRIKFLTELEESARIGRCARIGGGLRASTGGNRNGRPVVKHIGRQFSTCVKKKMHCDTLKVPSLSSSGAQILLE